MKKKIIYLVIIFIFALIFFNTTSFAGSQSLNSLKYDVNLNEDGSVDIVETWDIYVYDTNTLFKTFELDSSKYGEITQVKVEEISKSGQISEFIKTDTYAYHVEKGHYYALNIGNDEFEIAWGVSINSSANRTYKISYTVTDAIKTYNDCSEFYWQFIGDNNGIPADEVSGIIKLPKAVSSKENLKVWAHGPLQGEIQIVDNETVSFEVQYLPKETMIEVRIVPLENIFIQNTNVLNRYELENIIEEETVWADEANRERERLIREQKVEEMILGIITTVVILLIIGVLIFFIIKIIKYIKELLKVEKIKPETQIEYFRDIPDKETTPAEAAFLYYFDKKNLFNKNVSKIVSAIMLSLALKKAISFQKDEKDKINIIINKNIEKLKHDEQAIYDLLVSVDKYSKKDKEENKISMQDIEKYAKKNDTRFLAKIEGLEKNATLLAEMTGNYREEENKESKNWAKKKNRYYMAALFCVAFIAVILPIFAVIPCIICGSLCKLLENKTRTLTQKGVNKQEEWKGLKRYMENFSLLDEREVPELALWEEYLVYATAFGVADKVLSQLKIKYPELIDDDYMISHGYTSIYMMNRYNFDRMLTSSMQKAYNAGISARNARRAAASSSYSSGGGRRRRLFWRRTAGGGGRRPEWAEDNLM